jgi:hypothetical protein
MMIKKRKAISTSESPQIFNILKDIGKNKFSRREFIEAASLTTTAVVISGCSKPKTSFDGTVKITAATLYSGPSTRYIKLGQLAKDKAVTINGRNDSSTWFRPVSTALTLPILPAGKMVTQLLAGFCAVRLTIKVNPTRV